MNRHTDRKITGKSRLFRTLGVLSTAGALLFAGTQIVAASTTADPDTTFTGCLAGTGGSAGKLVALKKGFSPLQPCGDNEEEMRVSGGDLTSFVAGPGLRNTSAKQSYGITTSGGASVELAPSYRLPQNCASNDGTKWSAGQWTCAPPPPAAPAPPRPLQYNTGKTDWDSMGQQIVGNDWSTVGSFTVPAGSWELSGRIQYEDYHNDENGFIACRVDVTNKTYIDYAEEGGDLSAWTDSTMTLAAFHTSSQPFTVAVICRDSWDGTSEHESGMHWATLRVHAVPSQPVIKVS
jgi:hypothetical protein